MQRAGEMRCSAQLPPNKRERNADGHNARRSLNASVMQALMMTRPLAFISRSTFVLIGESVCVRSLTSSSATQTGRKKKTLIVKEKRNIADGRWRFSSAEQSTSLTYIYCALSEKDVLMATQND
jgi:hypothetical protein